MCIVYFVTVGNKDDDPVKKVVQPADARRFAEQMNIEIFETSAKDSKNVDEVLTTLTSDHFTLTHSIIAALC
jgi:Ras-related protein Rab-35